MSIFPLGHCESVESFSKPNLHPWDFEEKPFCRMPSWDAFGIVGRGRWLPSAFYQWGSTNQVLLVSTQLRWAWHRSISSRKESLLQQAELHPCHKQEKRGLSQWRYVLKYGSHAKQMRASHANPCRFPPSFAWSSWYFYWLPQERHLSLVDIVVPQNLPSPFHFSFNPWLEIHLHTFIYIHSC